MDQVAEVKARTDIVAIVGERVELKKAGRNYKALCPFHGEKTSSFMVSPELQIFKCFGCDAKGDAFSFLMQYEGMEFGEALKFLADKAGIKLTRTNFQESTEKEKLIEINALTVKFYNYLLTSHKIGSEALNYLTRERGIKRESIDEFQLGYSPTSPELISKFLIDKKKFTPKEVERAGIGLIRSGRIFDRFYGRVIFPLFDHRGNPVGIAGRLLPTAKSEMAKYINSPETEIYHKSRLLYGLNKTYEIIRKKKVAIVVEGELDLISSYQAGIKNVVAIKGSALTLEQISLLGRFCKKIILALDSDFAGDAASRRGATEAINLGFEVKVARLTNFKDPDEAARKGLPEYKKSLIDALNFWDFLIESIFTRNDPKTGQGKSSISKEIVPILSLIADDIVRSHYVQVVAKKLGVSEEVVSGMVKGPTVKIGEEKEKVEEKNDRRTILEDRLITLGITFNPKALIALEKLISGPLNKRIVGSLKDYLKKKKELNLSEFSTYLAPELFDGFVKLTLLSDDDRLPVDEEEARGEMAVLAREIEILSAKEKLVKIAEEIGEKEEMGEKNEVEKLEIKLGQAISKLTELERNRESSIILNQEG